MILSFLLWLKLSLKDSECISANMRIMIVIVHDAESGSY